MVSFTSTGRIAFAAFVFSLICNTAFAQNSVTIVSDLQSHLGCNSDWDPSCASTFLPYDANDDVWQRAFSVPAGNWKYKAALNASWDVNYGLHASPGGDDIPLKLGATTNVKFYYDNKTHWVTDN